MCSPGKRDADQDAMLCVALNFSGSQRLRYASQTGAEPSNAGESGSVQEGFGQEIGGEKENDTWGYDVADAATKATTDVDKTPIEFVV